MTADLGQPLLSGGRYDGLPTRFGREMPATGFAVSLKLLLIALERQGKTFAAPIPDKMVGFDAGSLSAAIAYAREERHRGVSVSLQYGATPGEMQFKAQQGQTREAVYISRDGIQTWQKEEV